MEDVVMEEAKELTDDGSIVEETDINKDHLEGIDETQDKQYKERVIKWYKKIVKMMDISDAQMRERDNIVDWALMTVREERAEQVEGERKKAMICKQIEFYFSDWNLITDRYMRKVLDEKRGQAVNIEELLKF